jgi:NAD(P)-dependent dehydrogenase (short-subunit alcohol dehydrogenase family)
MLLTELRVLGVRAYGLEANLRQPQTPRHIFDAAHALLGAPTILVNNACHSGVWRAAWRSTPISLTATMPSTCVLRC